MYVQGKTTSGPARWAKLGSAWRGSRGTRVVWPPLRETRGSGGAGVVETAGPTGQLMVVKDNFGVGVGLDDDGGDVLYVGGLARRRQRLRRKRDL
jgi:hypothetical protein